MAQKFRSKLQIYIDAMSEELGFEVTQTQLAKATGVRQATISEWASGKPLGQISSRVLLALANYFKVESPWDLLEIVEDDDPEFMAVPYTEMDFAVPAG
ncbi:MAG: helix-turn-helix transcriptional regulator [Anaerolineae bacterium]|nr:helix-turn-helix transcriptional regulator [Anaerolineae bacterium]